MSSGGVFTIITNDGKQDKMLLATDLLEQRMNEIKQKNVQRILGQGGNPDKSDIDPQLSQITDTHIIHFQARFKPHVAVAMEYQKVNPQSGTAAFGNQVTFGLP